jgi:hypothetical protein
MHEQFTQTRETAIAGLKQTQLAAPRPAAGPAGKQSH